MARASEAKRAERLDGQARHYYHEGRIDLAIATWEKLLALSLPPEEDIITRAWLGCVLHNRGHLERASELLDPICFDLGAARVAPAEVYRIATRAAFVAVDRALPLARIESLMRRVAELAEGRDDCPRCNQWLAQGKLELARGRRAAGLRLVERAFADREANGATLSDTPYLRRLVPGALERGQPMRARELLDLWERCGDPEAFKRPHLEAFSAILHLQQGKLELALRWALLAREHSRKTEDISGRFDAAESLCRVSLRMGFIAVCRSELRKLLALRRTAGSDVRFAIELFAADTHAGLARHYAGLPSVDLESGKEQPAQGAVDAPSALAAEISLRRAEHACRRGAALADALDANLGSCHRRRAFARRRRELRKLRRLLASGAVTRVAPVAASVTGASTAVASAAHGLPPASPVVLESDATECRLTLPVRGLRSSVSAMKNPDDLRLVLYPTKGKTPLRVDVWHCRKWRFPIEVDFAQGRGGPWCTLRAEPGPASRWLEQLAAAARRHQAKRLWRSGERALARGACERAALDFDAARALSADRWEHWEADARARIALGRPEEAFALCLKALELHSTGHQVWQSLADILEAQGRLSAARHALRQALARAPGEGSTVDELTARVAKLGLQIEAQEAQLDPRQPGLPLN
jgi:tetratricopeptide (TPR) repeat protein